MPLIQDIDRVSTPRSNSPVTTFHKDRERRELNVSKVIKDLFPDETPFLAITNEVAKEIITSQEIIWYDQKPGDWWTQAPSGADDEDVEIAVSDSSIFRPRDLVKVTETGEVLLVNSIDETPGSNTITVTRGYAGTNADDISEGGWLMRIGNAMEQFSRAPEEKIVQPVRQFNYTQIFRTPFSESETSSREGVKTKENERKRLARLKLKEHVWDIERALIFGERFSWIWQDNVQPWVVSCTSCVTVLLTHRINSPKNSSMNSLKKRSPMEPRRNCSCVPAGWSL